MYKIVAVDDEIAFLDSIKRGLLTSGYKDITLESDSEKIADLIKGGEKFDIALLDITMPGLNGLELLEIIKSESPETECIMISARDDAKSAISAMKKGAYDYLLKPLEKNELIATIERALERKKLYALMDIEKSKKIPELENPEAFSEIITCSEKMLKLLKEAELHALSNIPILLTGESGTGKELLANGVHLASQRSTSLFIPVNMASVTGSLFDSEFYGHTKGAYTGAANDRKGYLETAHSGSLFLDEIGTLPLELQGKLLRVIQGGEFIKIGTNIPRKTGTRFIAATNESLTDLIKEKKFRNDLYYRLKGGWIHLPPLRERKEDIPLLIKHFFKEITSIEKFPIDSDEVMGKFMSYDYPGNIRELKAIVHSCTNLSKGKSFEADHLPVELKTIKKVNRVKNSDNNITIKPLSEIEKEHILNVYHHLKNNKSMTARVLGIGLNTLRRKLQSYGDM